MRLDRSHASKNIWRMITIIIILCCFYNIADSREMWVKRKGWKYLAKLNSSVYRVAEALFQEHISHYHVVNWLTAHIDYFCLNRSPALVSSIEFSPIMSCHNSMSWIKWSRDTDIGAIQEGKVSGWNNKSPLECLYILSPAQKQWKFVSPLREQLMSLCHYIVNIHSGAVTLMILGFCLQKNEKTIVILWWFLFFSL